MVTNQHVWSLDDHAIVTNTEKSVFMLSHLPHFIYHRKIPSCLSLMVYRLPLSSSRVDPALPHCTGVNSLRSGLFPPCCLLPSVLFFFLATLHSSHDTEGNPLSNVPWRGVCCHRMCIISQNQGKLDTPRLVLPRPATHIFAMKGVVFSSFWVPCLI